MDKIKKKKKKTRWKGTRIKEFILSITGTNI